MAAVRRQVYADLGQDFEQSWDRALAIMQRMAGEPDFGEGVASFTEKREPSFDALPDGFATWLDSLSTDGS
jgi:enoyl-CoA hydratase/carnithine racemase